MGIGAAENVISAAAMRCLGGHFQGQLIYDPEVVQTGLIGGKEGNLARLRWASKNQVYNADELASGNTILFAACGITPGTLMEGVGSLTEGHGLKASHSSQSKQLVLSTIHLLLQLRSEQGW